MRKLKKYKPTLFMLNDSIYDKAAADYAVSFIESLCHRFNKILIEPMRLHKILAVFTCSR